MYITCHIAKRQLFAGNAAENISFFFFFFPHVVKFPRRFILLPTCLTKLSKLEFTYIIFTTFTRPKSFSVVALTSFNISGASKDSVRRA